MNGEDESSGTAHRLHFRALHAAGQRDVGELGAVALEQAAEQAVFPHRVQRHQPQTAGDRVRVRVRIGSQHVLKDVLCTWAARSNA